MENGKRQIKALSPLRKHFHDNQKEDKLDKIFESGVDKYGGDKEPFKPKGMEILALEPNEIKKIKFYLPNSVEQSSELKPSELKF